MCLSPHTKTLGDWLYNVPVPAYENTRGLAL